MLLGLATLGSATLGLSGCNLVQLAEDKLGPGETHCSQGPEDLVVVTLTVEGDGYLSSAAIADLEKVQVAVEELIRSAGGDIGDRLDCEPIMVPVRYRIPDDEGATPRFDDGPTYPSLETTTPWPLRWARCSPRCARGSW